MASGNSEPDIEWEYVPIPFEDTDDKKAVEVKSEVKGNLPSEEDMKGIPEDIEDIFDRHGDDLMIDNSGHIYSLWKETGGEKHYRCINSDCPSSLVVEYIDAPKESTTKKAMNHP